MLKEEIKANFVDAAGAGDILEVSPGYASKLLIDAEARYIIHDNARAFYSEDVNRLYCDRVRKEAAAKRAKEEKEEAKAAKKAAKNAK